RNEGGQSLDNLALAKLLIAANPLLRQRLVATHRTRIERTDGRGFIEALPGSATGLHGKTYRLLAVDELHGHRDWSLLEALQPDPSRRDAQMLLTSYAPVEFKPGIPICDLFEQGQAGRDARMLFSWYSASYCTDPALADASPEDRANPSRASWGDPEYLDRQKLRLPSAQYRRLHLNEPGSPDGAAFQAEAIHAATATGVKVRPPEPGLTSVAVADMSGGTSNDATLAIAHRDADGRAILDLLVNQGEPAPFDPRQAVVRFAAKLRAYRVSRVHVDRFAGQTFTSDFAQAGVTA